MHIELQHRPGTAVARISLRAGESVRAEAGAMLQMDPSLQVATDGPLSGKRGGLLKNLGRALLGGESFFTNTFTAVGVPAEVVVAPSLPGDMTVHELFAGETLLVQGRSWVASPDSVHIDTRWQGMMRGLLSGESLFFLRCTGNGPVILNAFGAIDVIDLDGELIVDTGHLVAFTDGLDYEISRASPGLIASFLSGEGFVLRVRGRGRLYLQTRNPDEYGKSVGPRLPARQE